MNATRFPGPPVPWHVALALRDERRAARQIRKPAPRSIHAPVILATLAAIRDAARFVGL